MSPSISTPALTSPDDLLERSQRLEVEALAQVHDLFYPEIYRYVRFRLDDDRLVEDVTNDVFMVFLDALSRADGPQSNLRAWLLNTAAALVHDSLRVQKGRPVHSAQGRPVGEAQPGMANSQPEAPETGQAANEPGAKRELQRAIRQALAKLPVDQQHLLAVRFTGERSLEETAQAAAIDLESARLQQFRALEGLRRWLAEV